MKAAYNFLLVTEARASALFDVLVNAGELHQADLEHARGEFVRKVLGHELAEYTYSTLDGKRPTLFIEHNFVVRFTEHRTGRMDSELERKVYDELLDLFATWNLEDSVNLHFMNDDEATEVEDKHFPWG